jgi:hypothetical protein
VRKSIFALLLVAVCLSMAGCGGCGGGGLSSDLQRAAARKRPADDAEDEAKADSVDKASAEKSPSQGNESLNAAEPAEATNSVAADSPVKAPPIDENVAATASNERPDEPLTEVERRARSIANLEKIGQAIAAYTAKNGRMPVAGVPRDGELLISWRVLILPELGYPELYKRFRQNERWDGPNNKLLLDYIPREYQSPERFDSRTNYLGVSGPGTTFDYDGGGKNSGKGLNEFTDGVENTLALVEVDDKFAQEWTRPVDFVPNMQQPTDDLGSLRGEGAFGLLATGRLVLIPKELPASRLAALFTTAGGEPVGNVSLNQPTAEPPPPVLATIADDPTLANHPGVMEPGDVVTVEGVAPVDYTTLLPGSAPPDLTKEVVPGEDALAKARELLKELYAEEFRKARTPESQRDFLQKLLADIPNVEADPTDYYELVRIIRDLAASMGDLTQSLAACEKLELRFQVDPLAMRLQALEIFAKSPRADKQLQPALQEIERIQREAVAADRYEIALPSQDVWLSLARIDGDRTELARLNQNAESLAVSKSLYGAAKRALAELANNPDDAAANEAVGEYLCLVKSRWEAGMPFLARAGDIRLRGIASLEMASGRSSDETLLLAEQCWDLASRFKQPQRRGLHLRAVHHYAAVRSQGGAGFESVKGQRRIEEAADLYGQEVIDGILAPFQPKTIADDL